MHYGDQSHPQSLCYPYPAEQAILGADQKDCSLWERKLYGDIRHAGYVISVCVWVFGYVIDLRK